MVQAREPGMAEAHERTALLAAERAKGVVDSESDDQSLGKRRVILGAMWLIVFLGAMDTTIVANLVSDISSSFESLNQSSWVGTSYLLSTATFTPLYGRLADILGRRNATLLALFFFTLGTAICSFAGSMQNFLIGRLIAGMGGGGVMACSAIITSDLVSIRQRGLYQGIGNIFYGAGAGLGGPLGGFISDAFGWRFAFAVQLPLLALATGVILSLVRYTIPGQGDITWRTLKRIDFLGASLLIVSLGSLLLSLSFRHNDNLSIYSPLVWGFLLASLVGGCAFVLVEGMVAAEPVLPLRFLTAQNGIVVSLANFLLSMVTLSVLFFLPMFFEIVKGQSASQAGAHLIPNSVALSLGSLFAGWWIRRTGKYLLLTAGAALGPVISMLLISRMTQNSGWIMSWLAVTGVGFGATAMLTSLLIALNATVDTKDVATAIGLSYLMRNVGQVVGVAFSSSLFQAVLTSQLGLKLSGTDASQLIDEIRHSATIIATLPPDVQAVAIAAYEMALRSVYSFNCGLAVLCFLTVLGLQEFPLSTVLPTLGTDSDEE